jgi:LacI family transcriptional regulator
MDKMQKLIAQISGVSRSTVQRVLSDSPHVSDEVKEKVMKLAIEMGYTANRSARALRMKTSQIRYDVILGSKDLEFYQLMKNGMENASKESLHLGLILHFHFQEEICEASLAKLMQDLIAQGTSAIFFSAINSDNIRKIVANGRKKGIHFCTIANDLTGSDRSFFAGQDHYSSGIVAGKLLYDVLPKKSKVFCAIATFQLNAHKKRLQGFMDKFCHEESGNIIVEKAEHFDKAKNIQYVLEKRLAENPDLRGIFYSGAGIEGVINILKEKGLRNKVKLICFDKLPMHVDYCKQGYIDFIVDQNPVEMGFKAIKNMNEWIYYNNLQIKEILNPIHIYIAENI